MQSMGKITVASFLTALFVLASVFSYAADKPIAVRFGHYYSANSARGQWVQQYGDGLTSALKGKLKFEIFPSEQLCKQTEAFAAVRTGAVDGYMIGPPIASSSVAESGALAMFYSTRPNDLLAEYHLKARDILRPAYAKQNTQLLMVWWSGSYIFAVRNAPPIQTLKDFKGKKLRGGGGFATRCLEALGPGVVSMSSTEVYMALQTGLVDGVYNSLGSFYSAKEYEIARYVTLSDNALAGWSIILNLSIWNSLPADMKKAWDDFNNSFTATQVKLQLKEDEDNLNAMKKSNVTFYQIPPEERKIWVKAMDPIWQEYMNKSRDKETAKKLSELAQKYGQ